MNNFLNVFGGVSIAFLGAVMSAALCCIGSARATGMVGEAASGLLTEDPSQFSKCLMLQVIPGTQGLYGVVIAFFALLQLGIFSGVAIDISITQGLRFFIACMPMAFGGWLSAIYQGKVAITCLNIVSKQPNDWAKGMMLCITVEFYAILSLLISFLMLLNVM